MKNDYLIKASKTGECWECGKVTEYISITFESYMCSNECDDLKFNEYIENLQNKE